MTFPQQVLGKQDVPEIRDEKKPAEAGWGSIQIVLPETGVIRAKRLHLAP